MHGGDQHRKLVDFSKLHDIDMKMKSAKIKICVLGLPSMVRKCSKFPNGFFCRIFCFPFQPRVPIQSLVLASTPSYTKHPIQLLFTTLNPQHNTTIMANKTLLPRLNTRVLPRRPLYLSNPRSYHSYDHPPPSGPFNAVETSILSASLPHIPSHGFTSTTLSLGAKDAGYIDASTNLFSNGAFSLVHYHLVTQRLGLASKTHVLNVQEGERPMGTGAKVKALAWERLMANREVIHRWQEVGLLAHPISSLLAYIIFVLTRIAKRKKTSLTRIGTGSHGPTLEFPYRDIRTIISSRRDLVPGG